VAISKISSCLGALGHDFWGSGHLNTEFTLIFGTVHPEFKPNAMDL
jgi:hypothetical protein